MARSVSSLFLAGAIVYTAVLLLLAQPRGDVVLVPVVPNETVKAKQKPAHSAQSVILQVVRNSVILQLIRGASRHVSEQASTQDTASIDETAASLSPLPRPALHDLREGEWAEVVGYMAIARAGPNETAPVLGGYPVGQPFRVISRDGTFIRVQDLRSGQLGWINQTSLAHYTGYARRATPPPIMIATAPAPTPVEEIENSTAPEPQAVASLPEPAQSVRTPSRVKPFALGPVNEPAAEETPKRGLFMKVAARHEGDGFPALIQRALSGY